jgi:peptidoglycan/xylan/chitin deacetylase (PgdA/CDA1 family)
MKRMLILACAVAAAFLGHTTPSHAAPPPVIVSLTFDDGRADQMAAAPILASHGMHGTFFIISGRVGAANYLSQGQIASLQADGNEIGGHTVTHIDLTTVSHDEAARQACDSRATLMGMGFHIWDFAYPQGHANADVEGVVRDCGYNSGRGTAGIVSPGACSGCPFAEPVPPPAGELYDLRTPDSVQTGTSLADLQQLVTQAQDHGGGWVVVVMHHVCDACDAESITPDTLSGYLDWLQGQAGNGVSVQTVHDVIGGGEASPVWGPDPTAPPGDMLSNPSLETDMNADGVADCWQIGGSGTNTWDAAHVTDAHSGTFAEQVTISSFASGDRRLLSRQDLGQCSPPATPGHTYTVSAWYHGSGSMRFALYYRNAQGAWTYWAQSPLLAPASSYTHASFTTPPLPDGAQGLSAALSLRSTGSVTVDDMNLTDGGAADSPPAVAITSPADGATVTGTVPIQVDATDDGQVARVRFLLDGAALGSRVSGQTFRWNWDTTTAAPGPHVLTAIATDDTGHDTTSAPVHVTVSSSQPPTVSITAPADGSAVTGTVTIKATAADDGQVARVRFLLDGVSLGSRVAGQTFQWKWDTSTATPGPHTLTAVATDDAGNQTTSAPVQVTVT